MALHAPCGASLVTLQIPTWDEYGAMIGRIQVCEVELITNWVEISHGASALLRTNNRGVFHYHQG